MPKILPQGAASRWVPGATGLTHHVVVLEVPTTGPLGTPHSQGHTSASCPLSVCPLIASQARRVSLPALALVPGSALGSQPSYSAKTEASWAPALLCFLSPVRNLPDVAQLPGFHPRPTARLPVPKHSLSPNQQSQTGHSSSLQTPGRQLPTLQASTSAQSLATHRSSSGPQGPPSTPCVTPWQSQWP